MIDGRTARHLKAFVYLLTTKDESIFNAAYHIAADSNNNGEKSIWLYLTEEWQQKELKRQREMKKRKKYEKVKEYER